MQLMTSWPRPCLQQNAIWIFCLLPSSGKGMISLNAHCGPVDFLAATTSSLSPELLKRDSVGDSPDSACGVEDRSDNSSQESLQPTSSYQGEGRGKGRGVLLQYKLRSTSGLPGRPLTALGDEASDSSLESLEHSVEDGSIYELSDDPEMWVRGRTCERDGGRRDRVISAAVISGGKGFRRLKEGAAAGTRTSGEGLENILMVWQLPLTVWCGKHMCIHRILHSLRLNHLLHKFCTFEYMMRRRCLCPRAWHVMFKPVR